MNVHDDSQRQRERTGLFALLFGLRAPVDRRAYALAGFTLMLVKYASDALVIKLATGVNWTPLDYLSPLYATRERVFGPDSLALQIFLAAWSLPFLWIGLSMTVRRGIDAGMHVGLTLLLFFFPFLNYVAMLMLCALPTAAPIEDAREQQRGGGASLQLRAVAAVAIAVAAVGMLFAFSVYALANYGSMVFISSPALLGAASVYLYDRGERRPLVEHLGVAVLSVGVAAGLLLLFALEGAICLAMAMPLAFPMAFVGAILGRGLAQLRGIGAGAAAMLPISLGGAAWLEAQTAEPAACAVTSAIEVDAPRETVWKHVISFSELPPPRWPVFNLGIAHPLRATIDGRGVGAVRRCEFSTGAFVEPITVWDEPARLAFDVAEEPPPMREWSFHGDVRPPHLDGYFASERGEFRLVELPGGRTRLEGTTWYALRFAPSPYWRLWSDFILHRIHGEVLAHVARLAESETQR